MCKGLQTATWIGLIFFLCVHSHAQTTVNPTAHEQESQPESSHVHEALAYGTGFSVGNGYVLTAYHVVKNAPKVLVGSTAKGKWTLSEVIKTDPVLDLALIKTSSEIPALTLSRSDQVLIGLEITVIGYPQPKIQGLTPKITQGIINGYPNSKQQTEDRGYFQISAEVSRGNSGGPLIGPDGTVIGMIQRKLDAQRAMDRTQEWMVNISYALRSSHILSFLQSAGVVARVKPLEPQQLLRPYQIYEMVTPAVVSVIAGGELLQLRPSPK